MTTVGPNDVVVAAACRAPVGEGERREARLCGSRFRGNGSGYASGEGGDDGEGDNEGRVKHGCFSSDEVEKPAVRGRMRDPYSG